MKLQEEYIKRHCLNFKPIYHTRHSNIILKQNKPPTIVLTIKWEDTSSNPGYYAFQYLMPNHNGYLDGNYFIQAGANQYGQYDEYFDFMFHIVKWAKNLVMEPVKFAQISLAILEMFLYCFDGWIAERNLEEIAFQTIDVSLSIERRTIAINEFLQYLEKHESLVFDIYNLEFRNYENNYANWLVELIDFL